MNSAPVLRGRRWLILRRILIWSFAALLLVGIGMGICAAHCSLEAENNYHATLMAVRLVDAFVDKHGRWPNSWGELEGLSVSEEFVNSYYDWPDSATEIRERVAIDFAADPAVVAAQDPMDFEAIQPIGPNFEYRHKWQIASLQETLRKTLEAGNQLAVEGDLSHNSPLIRRGLFLLAARPPKK